MKRVIKKPTRHGRLRVLFLTSKQMVELKRAGRDCQAPLRAFVSSWFNPSSFSEASIPPEHALAPRVEVRQEQDRDEDEHLDEQEPGEVEPADGAGLGGGGEDGRPGVHEHDFDVEDQE